MSVLFPRSPRMRKWLRKDGVPKVHMAIALVMAVVLALFFRGGPPWLVIALSVACVVASLYSAFYWCVAEGDYIDSKGDG